MYYRLYLIRGDRFHDLVEIHAANDVAALVEAEEHTEGLPAELWCRGRRVASFGAEAA